MTIATIAGLTASWIIAGLIGYHWGCKDEGRERAVMAARWERRL